MLPDLLFLIAAALPSYLLRFSIAGIPMTLLEVMILLFCAVSFVKHPRIFLDTPRAWRLTCLFILLVGAIAILPSPDVRAALGLYRAYFIEPILLFICALPLLKTEESRQKILYGLALSIIPIVLFAIYQFFTGNGLPIPYDAGMRSTSFFPFPNALGLFTGPVAVASAILAYQSSPIKTRIFWVMIFALSCLGATLAQTEAAYIAIAGSLWLFALTQKSLRKMAIAAPILFLVILGLHTPLRLTVVQKITLHDFSGEVRRSQWSETLDMLKDRPLFGAGLAGYPTAFAPYHHRPEYEIFQYPHTLILNIWSELGLLGLGIFFWICTLTVKTYTGERSVSLRRAAPTSNNKNSWALPTTNYSHSPSLPSSPGGGRRQDPSAAAQASFFALVEMCIHGLVDVPYFKNDLAVMTWLFLAIIVSTYVEQRNARKT